MMTCKIVLYGFSSRYLSKHSTWALNEDIQIVNFSQELAQCRRKSNTESRTFWRFPAHKNVPCWRF